MEPVIIGGFVAVVLFIATACIKIVPQAQNLLIERLGRFHKLASPGLNLIVPFLDSCRTVLWSNYPAPGVLRTTDVVDLREKVMDIPKHNVITKDNVNMRVNSIIYWQITDPIKSVYEITDLTMSIEQLSITTLRNVIGELDLDQTLVSREHINTKLCTILDEATDKWGVKVNRVEIQDIEVDPKVRETMEKQMTAERNRRATVLQAEGVKAKDVLEAEGRQRATVLAGEAERDRVVLAAQGAADSRRIRAQAEADAVRQIAQAFHGKDPTSYLVTMRYLEALECMASRNASKVVFMPFQAANVLGALGTVKELLAEGAGQAQLGAGLGQEVSSSMAAGQDAGMSSGLGGGAKGSFATPLMGRADQGLPALPATMPALEPVPLDLPAPEWDTARFEHRAHVTVEAVGGPPRPGVAATRHG